MVLGDYFQNIANVPLLQDDNRLKKWNKRVYKDDIHQLLALILYMLEKEEDINLKNIYICPTQENFLKIEEIQKPVPLIECKQMQLRQIYNTLKLKRLYGIADNIGGFMLARDIFETHEDFVNAIWMHWEYYTKDTPLWTPRYEEYKGTFDHEKKKIIILRMMTIWKNFMKNMVMNPTNNVDQCKRRP